MEIKSLIRNLKYVLKKKSIAEALQWNPQFILVIRLNYGLSQKKFLDLLGNLISERTLINYEKKKVKFVRKKISRRIVSKLKLNSLTINDKKIINCYKKFNEMKKGSLTSERAKLLHKIWMKKTTKIQRKEWGKKGARITNTSQRLTYQEKRLEKLFKYRLPKHLSMRVHQDISTRIGDINFDFVVYKKTKPVGFIEATTRKHDLYILLQAYAYRRKLIRELFPNSWFIIVFSKDVPEIYNTLKNEFEGIFKLRENKLNDFIRNPPIQ